MKTEEVNPGSLRRPSTPLSPMEAVRLRTRERLRAVPPRRWTALGLGLCVGLAVWSVVQAARSSQARWGDLVPVVVAVADIGPGELLTPSNTELRAVPVALLPEHALTDDRSDRRAHGPIAAGQIVAQTHVGSDRHSLTTGRRAVTFPVPLAPPPLERNDIVDLIAVSGSTEGVQSRVIAAGTVVEMGPEGVTVTVDHAVVGLLFEALASGSVEMARRPSEG